MEAEQIKELAQGLLKYAKKHDKEIIKHNIAKEEKIELGSKWRKMGDNTKQKVTKSKGYLYLLECEGKYKLGLSKDVERRIKELNQKPFKLKLITKSRLLDEVYIYEQKLHQTLDKYRIKGEWYLLDKDTIEYVKNRIEEL